MYDTIKTINCKEKIMKISDYVELVKKNGLSLRDFPKEIQNNKEIAFLAVKENPYSVNYIGEHLKNDPEIIWYALNNNSWALGACGDELKKDMSFVLKAVKLNGLGVKFLSAEMRDSFEIMTVAFENNYRALEYASSRLKDNPSFACFCVKQKPTSIKFFSDNIKNNPMVVYYAIIDIKDEGLLIKIIKNCGNQIKDMCCIFHGSNAIRKEVTYSNIKPLSSILKELNVEKIIREEKEYLKESIASNNLNIENIETKKNKKYL